MHLNSERQRQMGRQNDWCPLKDQEKVSSVCQSRLIFCDTMNRSTPGLPIRHQLTNPPKPMSIELVMLSNHLFLCRPLLLLPQYFPASESLPRRSIQCIVKDISPECTLERMMLKMKLQYFGHLMRRPESLVKTLMLGNIEGRRRRGQQRKR